MSRFLRRHPLTSLAVTAAVLVFTLAACKAATPTSPNTPTQLTGQNPNETPTFNGTLTLFGGGVAPANGATDVAIVVEVKDGSGNPAANLTPVTFSTTLGTIRASGTDPALAGSAVQVTTWSGQAGALLRSDAAGSAVVTVSIGDKAVSGVVIFEPTASTDVITLAFREGGTDQSTIEGTTPFLTTLVAVVRDEAGLPIAGQAVRFRIVADTAGGTLTAAATTNTDASGEAFNVLRATQVGTVSLVAEILDGEGNVVKESNQIVATVTAESDDFQITLVWADESTVSSATAPDTVGMLATVVDAATGQALSGRWVRFRIVKDTAKDKAKLAEKNLTLTDGAGLATNAVSVTEADSVVTIQADLIASNGTHLATSNLIVLEVE